MVMLRPRPRGTPVVNRHSTMAVPVHRDTNYLIAYAGESSAEIVNQVENWIRKDRKLCCSAMAWAEFLCGLVLPKDIAATKTLLSGVLPISLKLAAEGERLFRRTGRRSRSLADCITPPAVREIFDLPRCESRFG